jgi:hypothetical protein
LIKVIFIGVVSPLAFAFLTTLPDIPDARIEGIWRQIIDVFRGGILADWHVIYYPVFASNYSHYFRRSSAADSFSLEVQESEENFDLALIASLEIDVIPQWSLSWRKFYDMVVVCTTPLRLLLETSLWIAANIPATNRKNRTTSRQSTCFITALGAQFLVLLYPGKDFRIGALTFYSSFVRILPKVFRQTIIIADLY